MPSEAPWLIFVDTNVFLDFYRLPGESAKRQLEGLLKHKDSLIVTEQVHMEYLKNRQKVITDGVKNMKLTGLVGVPSLIAESKYGKSAIKADKAMTNKFKKVQKYAANLLLNPGAYDKVYRTAVKLFNSNHEWNLKRPNSLRYTVRNLARKRFALGYLPRKPDDTSIGDAINWEWIVHCAAGSELKPNILIVSRDTDYGIVSGDTPVLNDWLKTEFKMRVGSRRKILLTNKLTFALKKLDEIVTSADEEAEAAVIRAPFENRLTFGNVGGTNIDPEIFRKFIEGIQFKYPRIPISGDDSDNDDE